MTINRRDLAGIAAILAGLTAAKTTMAAPQDSAASQAPATSHDAMMDMVPGLNLMGSEKIAMLIYPQFTALDLVGPQYFFGGLMGAKVELVTTEATLDPVVSDTGLAIVPNRTLADASPDLDVVFVPGGGTGTLRVMEIEPVLAFLRACADKARYVTSTCTGSLVLASAGLLKGHRATSHWAARDSLADFGAVPVNERVVTDGKFVTGAGVSAGIDMAIEVTRLLRGDPYAQGMMLLAEYAPKPPIPGGTPETTEPMLRAMMADMLAPVAVQAKAIAAKRKA